MPIDLKPWDHVRVEVAFATGPDDPAPAFVDLTSRAQAVSNISITRGRQTQTDTVQPGRCTLTLDNIDGALTPGNAGSPYAPNVVPMRRMRVTYRDPATLGSGNLVDAESASFESGTVGAWVPSGSVGPTLANDATHPAVGSRALLVTWGTGGNFPAAALQLAGLTIGRTYTARAVVWVPAGSPNVALVCDGQVGAASTVTGAATTVTVTWTATVKNPSLQLWPSSAPTAGQQVWIDAVMVDEGATLGTFTTTPPPISYRFDGYIDEWPTSWPTGSDTFAQSAITAGDLLTRLGARQKLRSVVAETVKADSPTIYYPLSEPDGTSSVASIVPGAPAPLTVLPVGAGGGTLTFASGTGPPTDGAKAPMFAPASSTSGWRLSGPTPLMGWLGDLALEAAFAGTTHAAATLVRGADGYGAVWAELGTDASGHLTGTVYNGWAAAVSLSLVSSTVVTDGATHEAALILTWSGGTVTGTLVLDGVSAGTSTYTAGSAPVVTQVTVAGTQSGSCFTGTLSHVSLYSGTAPTVAAFATHRTAMTTGFAGERSDQRIARIAGWAGVPAAQQVLDVGLATNIAHLDCAGMQPLDYMRQVETTEQGLLYADRQGRLVFRNRAATHTYGIPSPDVTLTNTQLVDPAATVVRTNLQQVTNDVTVSRTNGPTTNVTDQASITAYGDISASVSSLTATDSDLTDLANWLLNTGSTPRARVDTITLDAYTDAGTAPALRTLDLLSWLQIQGMPSQAATSTIDLDVQGISETISAAGWYITANTTLHAPLPVLILDDAARGVLDGANVLAL